MFSRDTAEEDSDWIGMTAEHYAQKMLRASSTEWGTHTSPKKTPTRPKKRISYSASIKELEVAYRTLFDTTIESQSHIGVLPPMKPSHHQPKQTK